MKAPHPQIAARRPDPEDYAPFFSPGSGSAAFVDARIRPDCMEPIGATTTNRVEYLCRKMRLGGSRSRRRDEVDAYVLIRSMSARAVPFSPIVLTILEKVLRPGAKYTSAPDGWLEGVTPATEWLSRDQTFALQIIAQVRATGRARDLYARRAIVDLLRLHDGHSCRHLVAAAAGVVLGVLDPYTGEPTESALCIRLHSKSPYGALDVARANGINLAKTGRRQHEDSQADILDPGFDRDRDSVIRAFRETRKTDAYNRLEYVAERDAPETAAKAFAAMYESAFRTFNGNRNGPLDEAAIMELQNWAALFFRTASDPSSNLSKFARQALFDDANRFSSQAADALIRLVESQKSSVSIPR